MGNEETFELEYFSRYFVVQRIEAELNFFVELQNSSKEPMTCQSLTRTAVLEQPSDHQVNHEEPTGKKVKPNCNLKSASLELR